MTYGIVACDSNGNGCMVGLDDRVGPIQLCDSMILYKKIPASKCLVLMLQWNSGRCNKAQFRLNFDIICQHYKTNVKKDL